MCAQPDQKAKIITNFTKQQVQQWAKDKTHLNWPQRAKQQLNVYRQRQQTVDIYLQVRCLRLILMRHLGLLNLLSLYWRSRDSRDSSFVFQMVQDGESTSLTLKSSSFVKVIRFSNLCRDTLIFVSKVALEADEPVDFFLVDREATIILFKFCLSGWRDFFTGTELSVKYFGGDEWKIKHLTPYWHSKRILNKRMRINMNTFSLAGGTPTCVVKEDTIERFTPTKNAFVIPHKLI